MLGISWNSAQSLLHCLEFLGIARSHCLEFLGISWNFLGIARSHCLEFPHVLEISSWKSPHFLELPRRNHELPRTTTNYHELPRTTTNCAQASRNFQAGTTNYHETTSAQASRHCSSRHRRLREISKQEPRTTTKQPARRRSLNNSSS